MKKQLKFYILFILCLVLIPSTVSAHTISFGNKTDNANKAKYPIIVKAEGEISESSTFSFKCETDTTNTSCDKEFGGDGISSEGAVLKAFSSGESRQIGYVVVTNNTYSSSSGTFRLTGNAAGSSVNISYNFKVEAKAPLKTDANYSSIKPSQGKLFPEFSKEVYEYTIYDLKDTINSITLNVACDKCTSKESKYDDNLSFDGDRKTQIKISGLKSGNNNVEIKTLSESGDVSKLYTFTIIRGETAYDSAKLSALSIGDLELSPEFKEDVTEYSVSVPYSTKDLTTLISTTLKDTNAEVEITGADKLVEGENTVTIKVTSVNKDKEVTYTIKVTRLSSDDIILISYANGKITFKDAEGEKKTLTEEEFEKEYPTVWKDIKAKKYKFDKEGNLITDEDKKEEKQKDNKGLIIAIIAIVAVIIIGVSGYFLFRKKDPEKEAKKKEEKIKKKAEKKARKDRLKKMEEEYYNEYYGEDDEYEDEYEDEDESDVDKKEETEDSEEVDEVEDKEEKKKELAKASLVEDDYLFESSLVEEENEEEEEDTRSKRHKDDVVDIDSALEDLMNTKTYDFSDELKDVRDMNDEDEEDE